MSETRTFCRKFRVSRVMLETGIATDEYIAENLVEMEKETIYRAVKQAGYKKWVGINVSSTYEEINEPDAMGSIIPKGREYTVTVRVM